MTRYLPTTTLAIDPGPTESAWLIFDGGARPPVWPIRDRGKDKNQDLLAKMLYAPGEIATFDHVALEMVESFGMPVGREVFETVYWIGRFAQAADPVAHTLVHRGAVKMHLCGSRRAKDPNIRQALIDRFGGEAAIGRKKSPGPLYGISGDLWAALGVAVTWYETMREPPKRSTRTTRRSDGG